MIRVGILDGQTIQGVVFAKQLKKAGYFVVLFCDTKMSYGYHTRYGDLKVACPSTQNATVEFDTFFLDFLEKEHLDVVVPMNDYSAKYLSKNKATLKDKVGFTIPDYNIFMNAYDKNLLMKICLKNKIPHPKSIDLSTLKWGEVITDFSFPALIKPNETTGARGFMKVGSFIEMWNSYESILNEYGPCHLQQFIRQDGMQYKVQLLMENNEITNSSVIEKFRYYPINGGSSCFNHTIENNTMVNMCTHVLKLLKWEGFADFDLIEDPEDGIVKIMEINPRVPACIKASIVSGIDFPKAIVDMSLNKKVKKFHYSPDKYLRYFSMDLLWLFSNPNKLEAFRKWRKRFLSPKHFLQDGEFLDPMSFIIGTYSGIRKQLNPGFRAQKKGMNI
jgi:predicted ATP-grasp superfamily ATP-dependent carboligase